MSPSGRSVVVWSDDVTRRLHFRSFADGKSAGAVSKQLQQGGEADVRVEGLSFSLWLEGEQVADGPQFEAAEARDAAITSLREALAPQAD